MSLLTQLSVDLLLDVFKLNIILLDVDVAVSEQSAHLLHISWSDHVVAMGSGHGLGQSYE